MTRTSYAATPTGRREFLWQFGGGLGGIALAALLQREGLLADDSAARPRADNSPLGLPQHPPRVRRVIQLFMNGGTSQMDTFDYKPQLEKRHGEKVDFGIKAAATSTPGAIMKCPFTWKQYGQCGRWVSSVFPHLAECVDEMAFLMAMASKSNVHGLASLMMNTGFLVPGFPCLGAWMSYGLGRLTDNLPTFVVLPDARGLPYNGKANFASGFLPLKHQGTIINVGSPVPIADMAPGKSGDFVTRDSDRDTLELLARLNRRHAAERPDDSRLESRIEAYELAARMQLGAPEALDVRGETDATKKLYGLDDQATEDFGRRCLIARRLIERGVRFVQVWSGMDGAGGNWDNHSNIHTELPFIAGMVDKPIAGLVRDLRSRGMFEDTLLVWSTEFGRMPFTQGATGRDHNGGTFVGWLAGAGIRGGSSYGMSDEYSYRAVDGVAYCYDLHATILHLLGIDHERLTVRHNGIDRRLTDVHGRVIHDVLA